MCGIAGFCRAETTSIPNGRIFARQLALSIEDRGKHATGFGWNERDDDANVYYSKLEGRAAKVADRLPLPGKGIQTLMAHTRHATKGDPKINDNNHPVVSDHIVAVHNGRVDNDDELIALAGLTDRRVGLVDSWAIPALLSADLSATPAELLSLVEGVAAVAWMDSNANHVLHLARLSTRPLAIAWTKRGDLVFASTPTNLRRAAAISKLTLLDITPLKEGTYLRIEEGAISEWQEFEVRHPVVQHALDMPGVAKANGKAKKKKAKSSAPKVMSHSEYLANLDGFDPWEAGIDGIDWDSVVPRRGWEGFTG
ncbi:MAG: hypothetical protein MUP76_08420 [Acidimicrobiia bacterium]|nr:hypothetical protein [Acidimicrobiia bacterium]